VSPFASDEVEAVLLSKVSWNDLSQAGLSCGVMAEGGCLGVWAWTRIKEKVQKGRRGWAMKAGNDRHGVAMDSDAMELVLGEDG
jgi:hypothetical protein